MDLTTIIAAYLAVSVVGTAALCSLICAGKSRTRTHESTRPSVAAVSDGGAGLGRTAGVAVVVLAARGDDSTLGHWPVWVQLIVLGAIVVVVFWVVRAIVRDKRKDERWKP